MDMWLGGDFVPFCNILAEKNPTTPNNFLFYLVILSIQKWRPEGEKIEVVSASISTVLKVFFLFY